MYYSTSEIDGIIEKVVELENLLSRHKEESDIYRLNSSAGLSAVTVHPHTQSVLDRALYYSELSSGKFDLTIGPLVSLWNINEQSIIPSDEDIERVKLLVGYEQISKIEKSEYLLEQEGMAVDLGGIAKGYSADIIRDYFKSLGVESAIINLGGNIYGMGLKTNGSHWNIGIQHPRSNRGDYVGILKVEDASFVTSGDYERYFEVEGKRYHHILDTETGYPLDGEIISSSIISKNSIDGDAISTITFGMSINDMINFMEKTEAKGIFITRDKEIYVDEELKEMFTLKDDSYRLKSY